MHDSMMKQTHNKRKGTHGRVGSNLSAIFDAAGGIDAFVFEFV